MGTPVAYLLDTEGRVAEPLAYGADEVPALARRAAGLEVQAAPSAQADAHDHDHDDHHDQETAAADGPKYLPASGGICNPGAGSSKKPRVWATTSAYEVGEYHIGVRTDSIATDELLGRVLSAHRLPADVEAPDNYSVVIGEGGKRSARSLNLLLWGSSTVVRSRSPRRILLALAAYLDGVLEPEGDLLRTNNIGAIVDDGAILLPSVVAQWLEDVQPRLSRLGVRLVDQPFTSIDPDRLELVVPEPRVKVDEAALAEISEPAPSRSEQPRVEPGRYPLRAWTVWETDEMDGPLSRARAVAASLPSIMSQPEDLETLLPQLSSLLERISPIPLAFSTADELAGSLKESLAGLH
jgi:hypothetical protein